MRWISMTLKGVLVVPPGALARRKSEHPATHRIANRPLIWHELESLAAAGASEVAVVAGDAVIEELRECVDRAGSLAVKPRYFPATGRWDLLDGLIAVEPLIGADPAVVHCGGGLLGQPPRPLTDAIDEHAPNLTLLIHHCADSSDRPEPWIEQLLGVSQLTSSRTHLALAGVCLFGPGGLRQACDTARCDAEDVQLIEIAQSLASRDRTVEAHIIPSWRRYDGDPHDLLELNRMVLDRQPPVAEQYPPGDNRVEGRVVIHPTAQVASSVLIGPSIIGARARLTNSYIGPYTSIGADAEIEGAEIVRSIVSDGARIMHIAERIEGSTIGRRSNVLREFGLPRALRLHVGERVHVSFN